MGEGGKGLEEKDKEGYSSIESGQVAQSVGNAAVLKNC